MRGSGASARASATRCCSPPESVPTERCCESGEADEREQLGRSCLDHVRRVAPHPQAERDVAEDVAMREERVILEDEADAAPMRRDAGQVDPVQQDASVVGHLQARRSRAAGSSSRSRSGRAR